MANLRIGLDVGTQSIGWAITNPDEKSLVATGCFIFPEGVDRDPSGGEKSKSQTRRQARGARRTKARRVRRKQILKDALSGLGLLPIEDQEIDKLFETTDPYELRARALDEPLEKYELGRVFYHFAQRRGFLSNRKTDTSQNDNKGIKAEMTELDKEIIGANCRSMGEYFHQLNTQYDHRDSQARKIRTRPTRRISREHEDGSASFSYEQEFDLIWNKQQSYHPEILTSSNYTGAEGLQKNPKIPQPLGEADTWLSRFGIRGIIFFQRKMYWPKSMVGQCELEPTRKRCPRADRDAQLFRIYQELNNLRWHTPDTRTEFSLSESQRDLLLKELLNKKELKFSKIRDVLSLGDLCEFNLERGNRSGLKGHETDYLMSRPKVVGKEWHHIPEPDKDAIVNLLVHEEREDVALDTLIEIYGLAADVAQAALVVPLPDGRMNYSLQAIKKLNPHLIEGKALMGNDPSDSAIHAAGYLRPDEKEIDKTKFLPIPPDITNPLVRQAVNEVRKLVNELLREYIYKAGHSLESIHVELAREGKLSVQQRDELKKTQRANRIRREDAKNEIPDGIKPTRRTVNRYLLWKEQDGNCIYSGNPISVSQLFSEQVDVDHILPRWRSLDDSLMNKVVVFSQENRLKADKTPAEWLEDSQPEKFAQVLSIADKVGLPYRKKQRLRRKSIELKDFVERNLRDASYIAVCVKQYLQTLDCKVIAPHGYMTSELTHQWGLHSILNDDGSPGKNRSNHKHHAIDAVVLSLIDSKCLFELANRRGDIPEPWDGFRNDVQVAINNFQVCHKPLTKINGKLHEETIYGQTQKLPEVIREGQESRPWAKEWIEDDQTVVRRKPISEIKNIKHIGKVRDKAIQELLKQHVVAHGGDLEKPFPKGVFEGDNIPVMKSGVPIKKVRMIEKGKTFRKIKGRRSYQSVKPGNNHHVSYYEQADSKGGIKWIPEVTPMWDAAKRARRGKPIVDRSNRGDKRFLFSLCIGEAFEVVDEQGEVHLCIVRKINFNGMIYFKTHDDARPAGELDKSNLYYSAKRMCSLQAQKVRIDRLGRVHHVTN